MPRTRRRHTLRNQQGHSLPMALLALLVGALLTVPLLQQLNARYVGAARYRQTMEAQYAADAGVEYVLWRLQTDPTWREAVTQYTPYGVSTSVPGTVNGLAVNASASGLARPFHYALFGNSQTCSSVLDWTGAKNRLIGNAHSNRDIKIQGADILIEGIVEYVTDMETHPSVTYVPSQANPRQTYALDMPELFVLSDYSDAQASGTPAARAAAEDRYRYIDGDLHINESDHVFDGLYFVTGDVKINGNRSRGQATFVALGTIEVSGSDLAFTPYVDDLVFFSNAAYSGPSRCNQPVISVQGSGVSTLGGYVYAPYGQIKISGSGTLGGAFVGDSIDLSGSGLTIEVPPAPGIGDGCEGFDIVATAGRAETNSRVLLCEVEPVVRILSWRHAAASP